MPSLQWPDRWRALRRHPSCVLSVVVTAIALSLAPGPALAADQALLLDLWVNGVSMDKIGEFVLRDGVLLSRREELTDLGFRTPLNLATGADGLIQLSALTGVTWTLDPTDQSVRVTAPIEDLAETVLRPDGQAAPGAIESGTGGLVNYDVHVSDAGLKPYAAGLLDVRVFSPEGVVSTGLLAHLGSGAGDGAGERPLVRLQSSYVYSDPVQGRRYTAGDFVTGGLSWTRPVRLVGVQVTSDYSMRPDLITFPLPSLAGVAAVPSAVDVLVNGARILSQDVNAGPFQVPQLPVVTGANALSMTVTNAVGRQVTISTPFYASSALLTPGLQTWSAQLGFVRRNYGVVSDDYGRPAASYTWRRGVTPWLTLESSGETTAGATALGGGAAAKLFDLAVANLSAAASNGGGRGGWQVNAGVQREGRRLSVGFSVTAASANYRDIAAANGDPAPTLQVNASAGLTLGRFGSLGVAFSAVDGGAYGLLPAQDLQTDGSISPSATPAVVTASMLQGVHARVVTASYSVQFRAMSIYATAFRDSARGGGDGVMLGVTIPFGARSSVNLGVGGGSGGNTATAQASESPSVIGDGGYQAYASAGSSTHVFADGQYLSPYGLFTAGVDHAAKVTTASAEAQGAIAFADGAVFATNTVNDSFAVVDTGGLAGVRVLSENRLIGITDARGLALAPDLRAFSVNHLAIDPTDVPLDSSVGEVDREVRPQDRSGVVVKFRVAVSHGALLKLVDGSGAPLPLGSSGVLRSSGVAVPIGYDGAAFVEDLKPRNVLAVELPTGARCTVRFDYTPLKGELPTIGPLTCADAAR